MVLLAGSLRDRIRIERPESTEAFDGAGSGSWALVEEVWASVVDVLPSRGERVASGINLAARPARVRIRYRTDVTASMRFVMDDRVMQIVAGPAVMGNRDALEFMVEDYSTAGNPA